MLQQHPFYPRLTALLNDRIPDPVQLEIHPSDSCNHACIWCVALGERKKGAQMHSDDLLRLVKQIGQANVVDLLFSGGGDPLSHPAIGQALHIAADAGLSVEIITNAGLLTPKLTTTLTTTCQMIRLSVDAGDASTYQIIHRPDHRQAWHILRTNIENLVAQRQKTTKIVTSFVLHPQSIASLGAFLTSMSELGVDEIDIKMNFFAPSAEALSLHQAAQNSINHYQGPALPSLKFDYYVERRGLDPTSTEQIAWPMLAYSGVIDATGQLFPCCHLLTEQNFYQGNVFKSSFADVWYGQERQNWYQQTKQQQQVCRVCINKSPNKALNMLIDRYQAVLKG